MSGGINLPPGEAQRRQAMQAQMSNFLDLRISIAKEIQMMFLMKESKVFQGDEGEEWKGTKVDPVDVAQRAVGHADALMNALGLPKVEVRAE